MARRKLDIRLPEEIVDQILDSGMTQTQFVESAVKLKLNQKVLPKPEPVLPQAEVMRIIK